MAELFPILAGDLAVLHATFCNDAFPPRRRGLVLLTAKAGELMRPDFVALPETEVEPWLRNQANLAPEAVQRILHAARAMEQHYMQQARDARNVEAQG